jgi:5'-nucleotidase
MEKPHLLLTNDDGIDAAGLRYLFQAIADIADVTIVAPAKEQSGSGTSFNYLTPVAIEPVPWDGAAAWKVHGSPMDCVKLGLSRFAESTPDLILSGINHGTNAGRTALYSGTVGGAIEGAMRGIPSIAFSCCQEDANISHVLPYILPVVKHVLTTGMDKGTLLNVNFPCHHESEFKGYRLARQGKSYWIETPESVEHPEGLDAYNLGGRWAHFEEHSDTDVSLLREGYITAAPLHISDITDYKHLEKDQKAFAKLSTG